MSFLISSNFSGAGLLKQLMCLLVSFFNPPPPKFV